MASPIYSHPLWGRAGVGASRGTDVSSHVPLSPALSLKGGGRKFKASPIYSHPLWGRAGVGA